MRNGARKVALVTGGSRGVGAGTALALAERGYDVALVYRNKAARAAEVATEVARRGARALPLACDITRSDEVERLARAVREWGGRLDVLVLCASGGMERALLARYPDYPLRINRDAQVALASAALPLMPPGGAVVFVTSHWAHMHGRFAYGPFYAPVAAVYEPTAVAKLAGELALREQQPRLAERGVRLVVVTADVVEDTIMLKLFERMFPAFIAHRREATGGLPTPATLGHAIVEAAEDRALPSGYTLVVGGDLATLSVTATT
jgi:NAD(P)-dependent dehydrogenase (short-subunit alcohol dehydrogenase family)